MHRTYCTDSLSTNLQDRFPITMCIVMLVVYLYICRQSLLKKERKFSSYIRKFRRDRGVKSYMTNGFSYMTKYLCNSSYMTLHLIPSEFLTCEENFLLFFNSLVGLKTAGNFHAGFLKGGKHIV
jgi:hypothetical protein